MRLEHKQHIISRRALIRLKVDFPRIVATIREKLSINPADIIIIFLFLLKFAYGITKIAFRRDSI